MPFSDPTEDAPPEDLENHILETDADTGILTGSQKAIYLPEIAARQHDTLAFLVFIDNGNVRRLRVD